MTFDDVTELLTAQRQAAWSEVARRVAHEIKNPSSPIQLSAERLKRKYLGQLVEDSEGFQTCSDTIIRQVKAIGEMVREFSSFSRLPPLIEKQALAKLCQQAIALQEQAYLQIAFEFFPPKSPKNA